MSVGLRHRLRQLVVLVALGGFIGCASTNVGAIRDDSFTPEQDEQALWQSADALDQYLDQHQVCYQDPQLQAYLEGVVTRLLPYLGAQSRQVRVHVLKDPFLNAFTLPNGSLYIHTGLLAQMQNEAQLATVLGHELTHFIKRHALKQQHMEHNRLVLANVLAGVIAATSGDVNLARAIMDLNGPVTQALVVAQVQGYSRDLEREATIPVCTR